MATLAEQWDTPAPKTASREDQRVAILQQELSKASQLASSATDAGMRDRASRDVESLNRELGRLGVKSQASAAPSSGLTLAQQWESAPETVTEAKKSELPIAAQLYNQLQKAKKDFGAGIASLADVTVGGIVPGVAGPITYAGARALGKTPEQASALQQQVVGATENPFGKAFGITGEDAYQQEAGRKLMDFIGQNINKGAEWISKQTGLPVGDVQNMISTAAVGAAPVGTRVVKPIGQAAQAVAKPFREAAAELQTVPAQQLQKQFASKGGIRSGGAAATGIQSEIDAAIAQATPELAADLQAQYGKNPEKANIEAINRQLEADQLPIPVRYTQGQASQNPTLISRERNERGFKEQFVQRFNEQNKALLENANLVKERTAPDVFGPDYVANAQGAIDEIKGKIDTFNQEKKDAYKALEDFGAGKIEVDAQTFANNAFKALTKNEDIDFLPAQIKSKIDAYRDGKPMNFDQFQNLTTQISRETRKAQKADDGNAVHALTLVRNELEKLPLVNETAEAKVLADKARSLAKREFDLLDKSRPTYNSAYAMVANEGADTSNFIQNQILRSKNKDFEKALGLFGDNPQAVQNLRAGTLDYIIRESTDASGNFLTGKFAKQIKHLDVNKKLDALFGPEDAKTLRSIANVGANVEARPKGSFVNESGTAVALGQMAKHYGTRMLEETPVVGAVVRPATEILQQRKQQKQIKEALRPGAGTSLKDIGKE